MIAWHRGSFRSGLRAYCRRDGALRGLLGSAGDEPGASERLALLGGEADLGGLRATGNVEGHAAAPGLARAHELEEVDLGRLAYAARCKGRLGGASPGGAQRDVALRGAVVD